MFLRTGMSLGWAFLSLHQERGCLIRVEDSFGGGLRKVQRRFEATEIGGGSLKHANTKHLLDIHSYYFFLRGRMLCMSTCAVFTLASPGHLVPRFIRRCEAVPPKSYTYLSGLQDAVNRRCDCKSRPTAGQRSFCLERIYRSFILSLPSFPSAWVDVFLVFGVSLFSQVDVSGELGVSLQYLLSWQ